MSQRRTLYLLTKIPSGGADLLLRASQELGQECSVVLVQDVARIDFAPPGRTSVLAEDGANGTTESQVSTISHRDLLNLIFEADNVVVL